MKGIIIFFVLCMAGMAFVNHALKSGKVLTYIDQHQQDKKIPEATYTIGQGYYIFQSLPMATTYFLRVAERYPKHELADEAYFYYLKCLRESNAVPRKELIDGYLTYLEKFPDGKHAVLVKNRLDLARTGSN